jgi:hypothetical protein
MLPVLAGGELTMSRNHSVALAIAWQRRARLSRWDRGVMAEFAATTGSKAAIEL